jgi:hypothetical protein
MMPQQRPQQAFGLPCQARVCQPCGKDLERGIEVGQCLKQGRRHRLSRQAPIWAKVGLRTKGGKDPHLAQKSALELTQNRLDQCHLMAIQGSQTDQGESIRIKERGMGILSGQEPHEELIEVKTSQQWLTAEQRHAPLPFGCKEVAKVSLGSIANKDGLERLQETPQD